MSEEPVQTPRHRRPVLVWLIAIYYGLSGAWTALSFILIRRGAIPMSDAQRAYFSEIGPIEWAQAVASAILFLAFAVQLFRLRASAIPLLALAFVLTIASTAWQMLTTNWVEAIGTPGLVGTAVAWAVMIAILLYCRRLRTKEILT